jgi:hypothetical protein
MPAAYVVALGVPGGRELDATVRSELMSLSATRELETFDNVLDYLWLALKDGAGPRALLATGGSGGLAAVALVLLGAALPLAYAAVAGAQPARNADLAARKPHIPWTPPPGGVEDEQR